MSYSIETLDPEPRVFRDSSRRYRRNLNNLGVIHMILLFISDLERFNLPNCSEIVY